MERFLERISLSEHKDNLILKGGTLISAVVGLDNRSTMDLDTTIKNLPLTIESAREIAEKIIAVEIDDGMTFEIKDVETIMEESDYSGIRVTMEARLETMRTPLKIDFSTGDVITPREIEYSFKLLFEDRSISVWAYNLETVLAEKIETLLTRGTANTRMRDFYDIYALETTQMGNIDESILREAFKNTCHKRNSTAIVSDAELILSEVEKSAVMVGLWKNYQAKFEYATDITWESVMKSVRAILLLCKSLKIKKC
jgi:predicted nucleotidyltransferase component of viral defense system